MKQVLNISHNAELSEGEKILTLDRQQSAFESALDEDIWKALQHGSHEALGYIYNKYSKHLFNFGCQLVNDRELVKDSIQDVFVTIGSKNTATSEVQSIKSYLFKALYRDIMKKVKNRKDVLVSDSMEDDKSFAIDINKEVLLINKETAREKLDKVEKELNNLSQKQRQVILHYYYDGLTYDEIAMVMGMTHKNTVAKLMKRALDLLRQNVTVMLPLVLVLSERVKNF